MASHGLWTAPNPNPNPNPNPSPSPNPNPNPNPNQAAPPECGRRPEPAVSAPGGKVVQLWHCRDGALEMPSGRQPRSAEAAMTRPRPTGQPTETAASNGPRPCDGKNSAYQVVAAACASAQHAACTARATTSRAKLGAAAESAPVSAAASACAGGHCAQSRALGASTRLGEEERLRTGADHHRLPPAVTVQQHLSCACACVQWQPDASVHKHCMRNQWNQTDGGPGGRTVDAREPTTQPAGKAAAKTPRSPALSSHSATSPSNMYAVTSSADR